MALFQKRGNDDEPENRTQRSGYVPASMRERPAPATLDVDDPEDEHDEEIEFLSNLAGEIDRASARSAAAVAGSRSAALGDDDEMSAFRQFAVPQAERNESVRRHMSHDVEIADLLDDLKVTAAALRRRRAA